MKHQWLAAFLALAFATGAQAQSPQQDCPEALASLPGKWEWQERAGARPFFMEITRGAQACTLDVQAWWPHSPFDRDVWQFSVAGEGLSYTGARHWHENVMVPEGEAPRQELKYEDGSGSLRLEGGTLRWDERKGGICKECRFTKVAPAVADANVPAVPDALELVSARDISDALRIIGTDGKGFRIVFDRVQRSADDPMLYTVAGKTYTGSGEQRKVRDFSGTLEVQRASLLPRTPGNAERYKGYPDGVTLGNIEAELALQVDGGAIAGTLRVPVLHKADGAIVPNHALQEPFPSGPLQPEHPVFAGYANGEFTGTRTRQGGASEPLTFSRMRFEGSELRVLGYDPKAGVFGEALISLRGAPAKPPKP